MKVPKKLIKFLIVLLCIFLTAIAFADEKLENVESRIEETFDTDSTSGVKWIVRGSKFLNKESLDYGFADAWPEVLYSQNEDTTGKRCYGLKAAFNHKGYNYLEIIPVTEVEGKLVHTPLGLKGIIKSLDVWVWGPNRNYYLEVHLLDAQGIIHVLFLGDLYFKGWKNLSTKIPNIIPQAQELFSETKTLRVAKFVVWTRPNAVVTEFFMFIDNVKILTDTFIEKFDGDELIDKEYLEKVWQSEAGGK